MPIDWSKPLFIAGTTLSSVTAGSILSLSVISIPSALETAPSPTALSSQWRALFNRGIATMPPLAILAAGSYFGSAYLHHHPKLPERTTNFILAGVFSIAIVPFTMLTMGSTNKKLITFSDANAQKKPVDAQPQEIEQAVTYWGTMNFIRGLLPLAATFFAFQAL